LAQGNVYSLNIVGYVNVPIAGGGALTLVSNPLKPSNGNYNITNTIVLTDAQTDAIIYKWGGTKWNDEFYQWYGASGGWFPDTTMNLGESFFIKNPGTATSITFVGEVETSTDAPIQYNLASGLNVVAPKTPVVQDFPGADVGHVDDLIYTWSGTAWNSGYWQNFADYGWFLTGAPGESTNGPTVAVGGGVVYLNKGTPISWERTFAP
jgi:hypothetical protein